LVVVAQVTQVVQAHLVRKVAILCLAPSRVRVAVAGVAVQVVLVMVVMVVAVAVAVLFRQLVAQRHQAVKVLLVAVFRQAERLQSGAVAVVVVLERLVEQSQM
jgi:hypothetical protein